MEGGGGRRGALNRTSVRTVVMGRGWEPGERGKDSFYVRQEDYYDCSCTCTFLVHDAVGVSDKL